MIHFIRNVCVVITVAILASVLLEDSQHLTKILGTFLGIWLSTQTIIDLSDD